jgi:HIP---CoA ligase
VGGRRITDHSTTPALVDLAAQRWPQAEALIGDDIRITFAELRHRVDGVRRAAMATGLQPGDRAAIWAPNSVEWVLAALGLQSAGVVIVPVNTRFKGEEAAYVLNRSGATALFTMQSFLGVDYPALLAPHETSIRRIVTFDTTSWADYLTGTTDADPPAVSPDDLSDIIFTSGTTGRPKGVMSTHGQTVQVFRDWCSIVDLRPGDRYAVATPFFHTFGYKAGFVAALIAGAATIPIPVVDVGEVLDLVERERVTVLPATPSFFQSVLEHPRRREFDLSTLRLSAIGGASVPQVLVERMRAELFSTVVTGYGLTESTGVSTICRPDDPPELAARTVGRAIPRVEIRVIDEDNRPVPHGTPGEVVIRGYSVMKGYFDAPDQTALAIDEAGWLHTGDIGTIDTNGYVTITDRMKDMFIVGGFNAYPAEIEAMLLRNPEIAGVAVIGVPDERLGEVGMAFIEARAGYSPTAESVIAWARTEMANYKVPRRVKIVDALPLNAVGKVGKDELRALAAGPDEHQHGC